MQIEAPKFDPDIDGPVLQREHHNTLVVSVQDLLTSPEPESIDATNTQEETAGSYQFNLGHSHSADSHRSGNSPPPQWIPDYPSEDNFTQQQVTLTHHNSLDEIPPLEEDWENIQFADADTNIINRHNSHSESE